MNFGFELAETASGTFHWFDDPVRDFDVRFDLRLGVDGLRRFARERRIQVDGIILAEGLAENLGIGRPLSGSIMWRLIDEKRIPYALSFQGDDGKTYHLRGQRDFFIHNAIDSLRTMWLSLYDDENREVGRVSVRFGRENELKELLSSFRPRLAR